MKRLILKSMLAVVAAAAAGLVAAQDIKERTVKMATQNPDGHPIVTGMEQAGLALENLKKNGMQVSEFSPAEITKFRETMKPIIKKHTAIVGSDVVAALQGELAKPCSK